MNPTPHKPGANRKEPARKSGRARNFSESRDIHEDRGTLQSKFGRPEATTPGARGNLKITPPPGPRPERGSSSPSAHLLPQHSSGPELHVVHLRFFKNGARAVCVAGTFNDWQPEKAPLRQKESGEWEIALSLAPGDYEYRFVADGEWVDDPLAGRHVTNPYGGQNAVLHIHRD
jgi:hypothetical protein